jgi:hypothetical protein
MVHWRKIPDFPKYKGYEDGTPFQGAASSGGTVKRIDSNYVLKEINNSGYRAVNVRNDDTRTQLLVHRIVAILFIPNPDNLPYVDHIDNNPFNNDVSNLRWATVAQNNRYYCENFKHIRVVYQYDTNGKLIKKWPSIDALLKVNKEYVRRTIYNAISGHRKTAYGYV